MQKFVACSSVLLLLVIIGASATLEKCIEESVPENCDQTDYQSYVDCMRRRTKRDTSCYDCSGDDCNETSSCDDCDCDSCSEGSCEEECQSCCVSSCTTRSCCHRSCHSRCKTSSCRRNCKKDCANKISTHDSSSVAVDVKNQVQSQAESKHNITTIINLHNMINNTNIIDIPVNINNTNINNITVEAPNMPSPTVIQTRVVTKESEAIKEKPQQDCCKIIGPRQCTPTTSYPYSKCFHYRKHHCGDICRTSIMHAEPHQVCDQLGNGGQSCHQQIAYIPQPTPKCSYTSSWPYVSCGIQRPNCHGCYGHVVQGGSPPTSCAPSCYDDGYNIGPLYRQGPVFQQGYSPTPECVYNGLCGQNSYQQGYPSPYQPLNPLDSSYQMELDQQNQLPYVNPENVKPGYNRFPQFDVQEQNIDNLKPGFNQFASISNGQKREITDTKNSTE